MASQVRIRGRRLAALGITLGVMAGGEFARGQCAFEWSDAYFPGGTQLGIDASIVCDDGSGPVLFVSGPDWAGGEWVNRLAKWDGERWSAAGEGIGGDVKAFAVLDDGGGPELFAAGDYLFPNPSGDIMAAKWNGASWEPVGGALYGTIRVLAAYDDGTGAALYAGGETLIEIDADTSAFVVKLVGDTWVPVAVSDYCCSDVSDMEVYDDGSGPALFVSGNFEDFGGVAARDFAKWDGATWSPLGQIFGGPGSLCTFDDGNGPLLYAGGRFQLAEGGSYVAIAKWDGSSWSALDQMVWGGAYYLAAGEDSAGPALFITGRFVGAGTVFSVDIVRWDGSEFSVMNRSINPFEGIAGIHTFDDGSGPKVIVTGTFTEVNRVVLNNVGAWDGTGWTPLGGGTNGSVEAFEVFDDGSGPGLYVGGRFSAIGQTAFGRIARWDGTRWSEVGGGMDFIVEPPPQCSGAPSEGGLWDVIDPNVYDLLVFDDDSGPALYATGSFGKAGGVEVRGVARWDGQSWHPMGAGLDCGAGSALAAYDDGNGPALYVGGSFVVTPGSLDHIAKWDGETWSEVGSGVDGGVFALAAYDDGSGSSLYAGGRFSNAGNIEATHIARWDGVSWAPLGSGVGGPIRFVWALASYDDGTGEALFVGGDFNRAGEITVPGVAKWDGTQWLAAGSHSTGKVFAFTVFDDGSGPALYAGGQFGGSGGVAKWAGAEWQVVESLAIGLVDAGAYRRVRHTERPEPIRWRVLCTSRFDSLGQHCAVVDCRRCRWRCRRGRGPVRLRIAGDLHDWRCCAGE